MFTFVVMRIEKLRKMGTAAAMRPCFFIPRKASRAR